jgi:hypothetical protein
MSRSKLVRDLHAGDRIHLEDPFGIARVLYCARSESIPEGRAPPLWLINIQMSDGLRDIVFAHPEALCFLE